MKHCNKCGNTRPRSEYHVHRGKKDGLQTHCKSCRRRSEIVNCLCCNVSLPPNKPKFCSGYCKSKWYRLNHGNKLDKFLAQLLRVKRKGVHTRKDASLDYLLQLWEDQKGRCAISNIPMTHITGEGKVNTNVSIDRVDSSKGYTEDNVQLTCVIVNNMKLDMSMEEFKFWCKEVLKNNG